MSDIFISYAREDGEAAQRFADAFKAAGLGVWWDTALQAGESFDLRIEAAIKAAKAVVVLWSPASVQSRWVRAEATLADRLKTLVPARIAACDLPIMFELTHTADLSHWQGDAADKAWTTFLADVHRLIEKRSGVTSAAEPAPLISLGTPAALAPAPGRSARPSIAVLPFTNRSGERADEAFAVGMAEDIVAALSLGRGLKVISHSATLVYRKNISDVQTIGRELGARYLLEGNVRRVGEALRVTAQLVEAETGAILWTQKFDRPLKELANLQEDLVTEVAGHLGIEVQRVEMERALKKPGDLTAWEAVMRSWAAYARFSGDSLQTTIAEARKAVAIAPDYAVAHATLAMALSINYLWSGHSDEALAREAAAHAERAIALNANHATVLFQVSFVMSHLGRLEEALRYGERAVELNPNSPNARQAIGLALGCLERYDESLAHFAEEDRVAPRTFDRFNSLGMRSTIMYAAGRTTQALATAEQSLALNPNYFWGLAVKAICLEELGRHGEAVAAAQRIRQIEPATPFEILARRVSVRLDGAVHARMRENLGKAWGDGPAGPASSGRPAT